MPIFNQFTQAQTAAWDYIRSAVEKGYTASSALQEYRNGGGHIRTQDWYRTFNSVKDYADTWSTLNTFTASETIPNRFYLDAPRNFAQKFVAEVELAIRNVSTGELARTFRYIESDYRMSQGELETAINDLGADYPTGETWQAEYIYGYKFYQKGK